VKHLTNKEFISLHKEIISRHANTHWDWKWFQNHLILGHLGLPDRFGWWAETVVKHLKPGIKVLDLASGIGQFGTYLMVMQGFTFSYTALDLSVMREMTEDYFRSFEVPGVFKEGDLHNPLPFGNEEFDMVWLFSWCQIERLDCKKLFLEINRVLKKNGRIMFNMAYAGYANSFPPEDLRNLLKETNFVVEILTPDSSGFATENFVVAKKMNRYPFVEEPNKFLLNVLKEAEHLTLVMRDCQTEFDKIVKMRQWVNGLWNHGPPDPDCPLDAFCQLAAIRTGSMSGWCGSFAVVLIQFYLAIGLKARSVSVGKAKESDWHNVVEVWSNDYKKWVMMDPNFNIHFVDSTTKIPLNILELRDRVKKEQYENIELIGKSTEYNVQANPKLLLNYFRLFSIYMRNDFLSRRKTPVPEGWQESVTDEDFDAETLWEKEY